MSLLSQLKTNQTLGDLLDKENAQLALRILAERARTLFPNATAIHLEETDQNDSGELWVQSLYDNRGYIIAGSEAFDQGPGAETVAFHLDVSNAEVWAPYDATTLKIDGRYVLDINKILAHVTRPPQTFRLLDASISHLPADLRESLTEQPGIIADRREYGWLLFVPEDIDDTVESVMADTAEARGVEDESEIDPDIDGIPQPIVDLWRAAQDQHCQYILIDVDSPTIPGLHTYKGC